MQDTVNKEMPRQRWMRAFALSDTKTLEEALRNISPLPHYSYLRKPESGMIMLEGKAGSTGQRFNLGEMLVTRCAIALSIEGETEKSPAKYEGHAYVMGNNPRHAAMAAVLDALMQDPKFTDHLEESLVSVIVEKHNKKQEAKAATTAASKVDFLTMVRGEDE